MRRATDDGDRGSVLVMAIVAVLVMGLIAIALARFAGSAFTNTRVAELRAERRAAANAVLRYGIDQLRDNRTLCTGASAVGGVTIPVPFSPNGETVQLTCTLRSSATTPPVAGWAVVVTAIGAGEAALRTQGGGTKVIRGPVFLQDPGSTDLQQPLLVTGGDVFYVAGDCADASPPTLPALSFGAGEARGFVCSPSSWDEVFTAPIVPAAAATPRPAITVDGCTVYYPGTYGPLAVTSDSYFVSGDYHFTGLLTVDAVAVGGRPDPALGNVQELSTHGACAGIVEKMAADEQGPPGATFVFSGDGRVEVTNRGRFEVFRRMQGGTVPVSIVAYQASDPRGSYPASPLTAASTPLLVTNGGSNSEMVVHGLVWAPAARLVFGNTSNVAAGMLLGGAVAAAVHLQSSGSASAFAVAVEGGPLRADVLMRARVAGAGQGSDVTATAELQVDPSSDDLAIRSWVIDVPPLP